MIYIDPSQLWETFEANKACLEGQYLTCAEDKNFKIVMTAERGDLCLVANDMTYKKSHYETVESEDEAVEAYEGMLMWLDDDEEEDVVIDEPVDDDRYEEMEPILAATYAFIGVLVGETPNKLGFTVDDLEDAAYQMAWYLRGRHDIDTLLA